jgi:hypothetical protein
MQTSYLPVPSLGLLWHACNISTSQGRFVRNQVQRQENASITIEAAGEWAFFSTLELYFVRLCKNSFWKQIANLKAACAILACFQFVPAIRHRFLIFHRINGYIIILLLLISNAGAIMICRRAFGGELSTQTGIGLLIIASTTSISMAYWNIKQLQIDQHRAWMLRTFFYVSRVFTW